MREARKLKQHKEDELGGEVLPQQLTGSSDVGVKVFLGLRALHGVHHQVHQLLLQHWAALLMLGGECVKKRIKKIVSRREKRLKKERVGKEEERG